MPISRLSFSVMFIATLYKYTYLPPSFYLNVYVYLLWNSCPTHYRNNEGKRGILVCFLVLPFVAPVPVYLPPHRNDARSCLSTAHTGPAINPPPRLIPTTARRARGEAGFDNYKNTHVRNHKGTRNIKQKRNVPCINLP